MSLTLFVVFSVLQLIATASSEGLQGLQAIAVQPRADITDLIGSKFKSIIVGGTNVSDEGYAPYQASLQQGGQHFCSAAIVHKNWLLTAAHCIKDGPNAEVVVGANNWRSFDGQRYRVKMYYYHSSYNNPEYTYDIGLVRVDGDIQYNDKVNSVKLWPDSIPQGIDLVATGWGSTNGSQSSEIPDMMQKMHMEYATNCRHPSQLCALSKGHGVCFGDSGSPLTWGYSAHYVLVGVANYIVDGCTADHPDEFASVPYLYDWIVKNSWESGN